jgi:hypothetical protein
MIKEVRGLTDVFTSSCKINQKQKKTHHLSVPIQMMSFIALTEVIDVVRLALGKNRRPVWKDERSLEENLMFTDPESNNFGSA